MRNVFIILSLLVISYLLSVTSISAVYDPVSVSNNKFGIHILFPSELAQAAKLVNSSGGEWGYVTIPIRSDDRNLEKWQEFFNNSYKLKVIPILRLATYPDGAVWSRPTIYDPIDWANFLDSLNWPSKNRYVIVYNEPNRADEWGQKVSPAEYAQQLNWTIDELKKRSDKFFVLPAGMDASAPNSSTSLDEYNFWQEMNISVPGIFSKIDGWASHSYPNPNYSSSPFYQGKNGITSYQWELNFLQAYYNVLGLKVFITETGWDISSLGEAKVSQFFTTAFNDVWKDDYLAAVTPFLLSAGQGDFTKFSLLTADQSPNAVYKTIEDIPKIKARPQLEPFSANNIFVNPVEPKSNWSAQKTNFWHETTKQWIKDLVGWFLK